MNAVRFPKMFNSNKTAIGKDKEATEQNLKSLLASFKKTLLGDPYFGTNLKRFTYEQNNQILRDLVIDDIYTAIIDFMPQIRVSRSDITVTSDRAKIYANIRATNLIDYTTDLYNINLTELEEM